MQTAILVVHTVAGTAKGNAAPATVVASQPSQAGGQTRSMTASAVHTLQHWAEQETAGLQQQAAAHS